MNTTYYVGIWKKITEFNEQLEDDSERIYHQVNSKPTRFGRVYNNLKSGWGTDYNDADILRNSQSDYMKVFNKKTQINHISA